MGAFTALLLVSLGQIGPGGVQPFMTARWPLETVIYDFEGPAWLVIRKNGMDYYEYMPSTANLGSFQSAHLPAPPRTYTYQVNMVTQHYTQNREWVWFERVANVGGVRVELLPTAGTGQGINDWDGWAEWFDYFMCNPTDWIFGLCEKAQYVPPIAGNAARREAVAEVSPFGPFPGAPIVQDYFQATIQFPVNPSDCVPYWPCNSHPVEGEAEGDDVPDYAVDGFDHPLSNFCEYECVDPIAVVRFNTTCGAWEDSLDLPSGVSPSGDKWPYRCLQGSDAQFYGSNFDPHTGQPAEHDCDLEVNWVRPLCFGPGTGLGSTLYALQGDNSTMPDGAEACAFPSAGGLVAGYKLQAIRVAGLEVFFSPSGTVRQNLAADCETFFWPSHTTNGMICGPVWVQYVEPPFEPWYWRIFIEDLDGVWYRIPQNQGWSNCLLNYINPNSDGLGYLDVNNDLIAGGGTIGNGTASTGGGITAAEFANGLAANNAAQARAIGANVGAAANQAMRDAIGYVSTSQPSAPDSGEAQQSMSGQLGESSEYIQNKVDSMGNFGLDYFQPNENPIQQTVTLQWTWPITGQQFTAYFPLTVEAATAPESNERVALNSLRWLLRALLACYLFYRWLFDWVRPLVMEA